MKKIKATAGAPRVRAEEMGGDQQPFEIGQEVTVISAPDPEIVGQTGTVQSAACGWYYAVEVSGAVSFLPDASLGGERPAMAGATVEENPPPAAPVVPPPAEATAAQARALAALGGGTVAGQLQAAALHALGRDVMARTRAASPDAAMMAVEGALLAAEQLPGLRAELATLKASQASQAAAEDLRKREAEATATLRASSLARTAFFDVTEEEYVDPADGKPKRREALALKAVWRGGEFKDFAAQCAAMRAGSAPIIRERATPDVNALAGDEEIPPEVADYAASRGITDKKKIRALARGYRGGKPQEKAR